MPKRDSPDIAVRIECMKIAMEIIKQRPGNPAGNMDTAEYLLDLTKRLVEYVEG